MKFLAILVLIASTQSKATTWTPQDIINEQRCIQAGELIDGFDMDTDGEGDIYQDLIEQFDNLECCYGDNRDEFRQGCN